MLETRSRGWIVAGALALLAGCTASSGSANSADSAPPSPAADQAAEATRVEPIPTTTFVYAKTVRPNVQHLYAFDVGTRTEKLVTKLDDDGATGSAVGSVALSPDRKWIAFSSYFRTTKDDIAAATGLPTQAIWIVSADGSVFHRVAAPMFDVPSKACQADYDCQLTGDVCDSLWHHCHRRAETRELQVRSFTPDGNTLILEYDHTWIDQGIIAGGTAIATVPMTGGVPLVDPDGSGGCAVVEPGDVHDGTLLAVRTTGTSSCKDGVYAFTVPPAGPAEMLLSTGTVAGRARWLPDGSGFVLEGNDASSKTWIARYDLASRSTRPLVSIPDGMLVEEIRVAPDGSALVVEGAVAATRAHDLFLVNLADGSVEELTTGGVARSPAW